MVCGICSVRWIMKPRPRAARGPRRKRAARARGERDQAEEERERERARPAAAALAPEGCEVARLGDGERGPERDLAVPDRDTAANGEVERRAQVEDGAGDEHPGARLVEA